MTEKSVRGETNMRGDSKVSCLSTTQKYASPTPFRISTITCTASINAEVDLNTLFQHLEISPSDTGISYVEYGLKKNDAMYKGFAKKFLINRRRERPAKRFDNQLTIIYKLHEGFVVNMKVFRNGNIQMTGIKNVGQGSEMVDVLIDIIKQIYEKDPIVVSDIDSLKNTNYKICLINTDFKAGFEVKRDNMFKLIVNEYQNIVSYEPCIYPGVKIQYFWNSENEEKDGNCRCGKKCHLKKKSGTGHGENNCKKITIAVFASGACIITGSQTNAQIEECYKFITGVLYENIDKIEKKDFISGMIDT